MAKTNNPGAALTGAAQAARRWAVDQGVTKANLARLATTIEILARIWEQGANNKVTDEWIGKQAELERAAIFGIDSAELPVAFGGQLVRIFSDGYKRWVFETTGKNIDYAPTRFDTEALARDIVPYLRARSKNGQKRALSIWTTIVENYFSSELDGRSREHLLRSITPYLQPLELSPIGLPVEESFDAGERQIVNVFKEFVPKARVRKRDVTALIELADGRIDTVLHAIRWMFSPKADDFIKKNRPYSLAYVVQCWDRWERARPTPESIRRRKWADDELKAQIRAVTGG